MESNKEKQIKELKEKIKQIRIKGTFKDIYIQIRKATLKINKDKSINNSEKKKALKSEIEKIFKENEE